MRWSISDSYLGGFSRLRRNIRPQRLERLARFAPLQFVAEKLHPPFRDENTFGAFEDHFRILRHRQQFRRPLAHPHLVPQVRAKTGFRFLEFVVVVVGGGISTIDSVVGVDAAEVAETADDRLELEGLQRRRAGRLGPTV